MNLLIVHGPQVTGPIPDIDRYVMSGDRSPFATELAEECSTSTPRYLHPKG